MPCAPEFKATIVRTNNTKLAYTYHECRRNLHKNAQNRNGLQGVTASRDNMICSFFVLGMSLSDS